MLHVIHGSLEDVGQPQGSCAEHAVCRLQGGSRCGEFLRHLQGCLGRREAGLGDRPPQGESFVCRRDHARREILQEVQVGRPRPQGLMRRASAIIVDVRQGRRHCPA